MIDTKQRRERIEQLASNRFPDCHVVFLDTGDGALSFRIQAANGKFRTGTITLPKHHTRVTLNKAWLDKEIEQHGGPTAA